MQAFYRTLFDDSSDITIQMRIHADGRWGTMIVVGMSLLFHASAQQKKPSGPTQVSLLDDEAKVFAQRFWGKVFRKCPDPPRADSFFTYCLSARLHFVGDTLHWRSEKTDEPLKGYCCESMTEIKGLTIQTRADRLTEADKLNGITWKGTSIVTGQAHRQREQRDGTWGDWTPWGPGGQAFGADTNLGFFKINGAWRINEGFPNPAFEPLSIDELAGVYFEHSETKT